ncbi:hypothetical protein EI546_13620 [Aequorivita sp. H23M31]|uniref:Uncharacterized protein n=1 Tax=Aequorivita ciconiae TaxID=2494375 RepID=A0A410G605_9FLAO|nr:hypothetical protein [Aequorivita sp. H23M31]QAA82693.1 hypothetical protein EI546_13620 [Aequorivita sp. H23M31]
MMKKEKDDFSKDVESIFRKSVEINKHYLKQSAELAKTFGSSGRELKNLKLFQPELMMGALTSFTKMNLDHYKNMMDLGFALTKKALIPDVEAEFPEENPPSDEPSFILSAISLAGENVSLQFILDNVKKEEASCQLVNSEYVDVNNNESIYNFPTVFRPQSFHLAPGVSQTVAINISLDANIPLGTYQSKVQVLGFESSYFLIRLSIVERSENDSEKPSRSRPIKKPGNGRQDEKRPKQQ